MLNVAYLKWLDLIPVPLGCRCFWASASFDVTENFQIAVKFLRIEGNSAFCQFRSSLSWSDLRSEIMLYQYSSNCCRFTKNH
jgi:hypothetical protein